LQQRRWRWAGAYSSGFWMFFLSSGDVEGQQKPIVYVSVCSSFATMKMSTITL
jgi:hypothetical protein